MLKIASLSIIAVLVIGCSGNPVEPTYYLLRPASGLDTRTLVPSGDFALGNVTIAPYVDQQGLLLETRAGEIRPARHHLWAEPMYESVRTFLMQEISRARGVDIFSAKYAKSATLVDIRIDQLHGTHDGKAVLAAFWWLRRNDEILRGYQYSDTRVLGQDGYAALAEAEKALLSDLAGRIADTLTEPPG